MGTFILLIVGIFVLFIVGQLLNEDDYYSSRNKELDAFDKAMKEKSDAMYKQTMEILAEREINNEK